MEIKFLNTSHYYEGYKKDEFVAAIKDINLSIDEKNEFVAICGKTGSGKSTLIKHMNGLLLPTSGTVDILGNIITPKKKKNPKMLPIRKRVGFVFQFPEYQLFEETVLKDIIFAPKNFGYSDSDAKKKAVEVCKLLRIDPKLLAKSPFNLSGGQMRKVAIAGILAYDPDILILDEPTRGLDPFGAKEIMEIFNKIHKEMGKTIVLISHDMDLVYRFATRVVVMSDGDIKYDGDKVKLFESDIYKEYDLDKPQVLKAIDYIKEETGYSMPYDTYTLDSLLDKLKEGYHE